MTTIKSFKKQAVEFNNFTDYVQNDPIYKTISKVPVLGVWFIVACINISVTVAVGLSIDYLYPNASNLFSIRNIASILNVVNVWLFFFPTFWAFYRWLPEASITYVKQIEDSNILKTVDQDHQDTLSELLRKRISKRWIHILALAVTVATCLYNFFVLQLQKEYGVIDFFNYTSTAKFFLYLLLFPSTYIMWIFIIRVSITIFTINNYFRIPDRIVCLYPLHPDKCGGMGNIGLLMTRISMITITLIIPFTMFQIYTYVAGGDIRYYPLLIGYIIYIALQFSILIFLIWQPHNAMVAYKHEQLKAISQKIMETERKLTDVFDEKKLKNVKDNWEYYKCLQELQIALEKQIPTWPIFFLTALRNIAAAAGSSTVMFTLISFALNLLDKYLGNFIAKSGTPAP